MPFRGKSMTIYGAFGSKAKAKRAESAHAGSFIRKMRVRGSTRFVVMKPRKK